MNIVEYFITLLQCSYSRVIYFQVSARTTFFIRTKPLDLVD